MTKVTSRFKTQRRLHQRRRKLKPSKEKLKNSPGQVSGRISICIPKKDWDTLYSNITPPDEVNGHDYNFNRTEPSRGTRYKLQETEKKSSRNLPVRSVGDLAYVFRRQGYYALKSIHPHDEVKRARPQVRRKGSNPGDHASNQKESSSHLPVRSV